MKKFFSRLDGKLLAQIIDSNSQANPGINFYTNPEHDFQVASMIHPAGKQISPHVHKENKRTIFTTTEVLLIKKGSLKITIYDFDKSVIDTIIGYQNDILILFSGGHGFEVLEDLEMIEIKQGPYVGNADKVRF